MGFYGQCTLERISARRMKAAAKHICDGGPIGDGNAGRVNPSIPPVNPPAPPVFSAPLPPPPAGEEATECSPTTRAPDAAPVSRQIPPVNPPRHLFPSCPSPPRLLP